MKLSLCPIKHHATKTHWGAEAQLHAFPTTAQDGGERLAPPPGSPIPGGRAPGTHHIGGRVGPRADLDEVAKEKRPIIAASGN